MFLIPELHDRRQVSVLPFRLNRVQSFTTLYIASAVRKGKGIVSPRSNIKIWETRTFEEGRKEANKASSSMYFLSLLIVVDRKSVV